MELQRRWQRRVRTMQGTRGKVTAIVDKEVPLLIMDFSCITFYAFNISSILNGDLGIMLRTLFCV